MTPKNTFFGLLGTSVGLIAVGIVVYYYFNANLEKLNSEVSILLAEQDVVGQQIDAYKKTEKQIAELSFVEQLANQVLPQSKEQANVVAEIRQFITSSGLELESLSFSNGSGTITGLSNSQTEAAENLAGVRILPATAVIAPGARYESVLTLLRKIETNQRKMQVTEVGLTPVPGSDTLASVTINLNIYLRATTVTPAEQEEAKP